VYGKAPIGVAARAKAAGVPNVFAINGSAGPGIEAVLSHGIDKYYMCFTDEEVSSLSPADLAARTPDRLRRLTRLALEDTSP
jgi:glycerate kinase